MTEKRQFTLKDLAAIILSSSDEEQAKLVGVFDNEYGEVEVWHGIFKESSGFVYLSDELTDEMFREINAARTQEERTRAYESWNRPEVREAQEKGLLP